MVVANLTASGLGVFSCSQVNNQHKIAATIASCERLLADDLEPDKDKVILNNGFYRQLCLVQEPYILNNKVKIFTDKIQILCSNEDNPRACIFANKNIKCFLLHQFSNRDQVAITVKFKDRNIIFCSVYCPGVPADPPPSNLLIKLVKYSRQNNIKLICGADCNSHNECWGSTDNNKRGIDLMEYFITENLIVCNNGVKPTFRTKAREEVLDVTFVSSNVADNIHNWKVSGFESMSDHLAIDFILSFEPLINDNIYRNVRRTDWTRYRNTLINLRSNKGNITDLNEDAKKLQDDIIEAFQLSCKEVKGRTNKKPPWWCKELDETKRKVTRLKRRVDRLRTDERYEEYRLARNEHRYLVKKEKNKGWRKLCDQMSKLDTAAKIQKVIKTGRRQEIGTFRKPDGTYTDTVSESLQVLLDKHFPTETNPLNDEPLDHTGNHNMLDIDKVINIEAVRASIRSFKPFKAPGYDGIYPVLLQKGLDIIEDDMLQLYRMCLREGRSPDIWLDTRVAFIPKPGKKDYTDPGCTRPISLGSYATKGLERIISWHLNSTLLRDKLDKDIFSYREGVGCDDAIHNLVYKIEKSQERFQVCMVLFLDMSAAFNNVSVNGMLKALRDIGAEKELMQWIEHMLKNRKVYADINGEFVWKLIKRGIPQGGILSVILWNLIMLNLKGRIPTNHPTFINIYGDDKHSISIGIDENYCAGNLQDDIAIFEEWAAEHGLQFSPDKTKVMLFSRKRDTKRPDLFIRGQKIQYVSEYKYLGVWISDDLTWKKHIEKVAQKAKFTMWNCRTMMSRSWGLNPKISKWMYCALVRPIMTYSSLVWIKSTDIVSHMSILEKVQRLACLGILNAMRSTPTAGMENIPPIHLQLCITAITTYKRLIVNGNWRVQEGEILNEKCHTNIIRRITSSMKTLHLPRDKLIHSEYICTLFKTEILPREVINRTKKKPRPPENNMIYCFTDGSKNKTSSGYGYLINDGTGQIKMHRYYNTGELATVYQTELLAIQEAAFRMVNAEIRNKSITFFIDNQASIKSLGNYIVRSDIVLNTKNTVNTLSKYNQVTLSWIPGHSQHKGNEVADCLARMGTEMKICSPGHSVPLAEAVINDEIKQLGRKVNQTYWDRHPKCRQTKMMLPVTNSNFWKQLSFQPRKMMNMITQLYTGHSVLRRHLHLMAIEDGNGCEQCDEGQEETVEHFLCHCPAFARNRRIALGYISLSKNDLPRFSLKKILKFVKSTRRFELD